MATQTKFNPENKSVLTIGEALDPAMKITEQEDADQYKAAYLDYTNQFLNDKAKAEEIVNANLGYYAGYGSSETRERVERLFKCSHPVFGSIKANGVPSVEKAISLGKQSAANPKNN